MTWTSALPAQNLSDASQVMVPSKETGVTFHYPTCPAVSAASRSMIRIEFREAKLLKALPHDACVRLFPPIIELPASQRVTSSASYTVYIRGSGEAIYHDNKDCPRLGAGAQMVDVSRVAKTYVPCEHCRPPLYTGARSDGAIYAGGLLVPTSDNPVSGGSAKSPKGKCWVSGYTTKKGKSVGGYWRKCS